MMDAGDFPSFDSAPFALSVAALPRSRNVRGYAQDERCEG